MDPSAYSVRESIARTFSVRFQLGFLIFSQRTQNNKSTRVVRLFQMPRRHSEGGRSLVMLRFARFAMSSFTPSGNQAASERLQHGFGLGMHMQLLVNAPDVKAHGVQANRKLIGAGLIAVSFRQQP